MQAARFLMISCRLVASHRPVLVLGRTCDSSISRLVAGRVVVRGIHATIVSQYKYQVDSENQYAHSVLERLPGYAETLCAKGENVLESQEISPAEYEDLLQKDWSESEPSEVQVAFNMLSRYVAKCPQDISSSQFDGICQAVCRTCAKWSAEQILDGLYCLSLWPETKSTMTHNFKEVWNAIDCAGLECRGMTLAQQLLMCDYWHRLGLAGINLFNGRVILRTSKRAKRLSAHNLVQLMFYVNVKRRLPKETNMFEFEYVWSQVAESLTVEETAVVAMGFFKTQSRIHTPELVYMVMEMAAKNVGYAPEVAVCALLKIIRKSMRAQHLNRLQPLLEACLNRIQHISLMTCLQVGLLGSNFQVFHPELTKAVVGRFLPEISQVRLKELERLAFIVTSSQVEQEKVLDAIAEQLLSPNRKEEIETHPKVFMSTLHYLLFKGPIPTQLLEIAMLPNAIRNWYGNNATVIGREVLMIDMTLDLEWKDFPSRCLKEKNRNYIIKTNIGWVPPADAAKMPNVYMNLWGMKKILDGFRPKNGDVQYTHLTHVLPHFFNADLVFCLDSNGHLMPLSDAYVNLPVTSIKYPESNGGQWCCIVYLVKGAFVRDTTQALGIAHLKARQLRKAGYTVLEVPFYDWEDKSAENQEAYLKEKINEAISQVGGVHKISGSNAS